MRLDVELPGANKDATFLDATGNHIDFACNPTTCTNNQLPIEGRCINMGSSWTNVNGAFCSVTSNFIPMINGEPRFCAASGAGVGNERFTSYQARTLSNTDSVALHYYYQAAAYNCIRFAEYPRCQELAHLCVLSVYSRTDPGCYAYNIALGLQYADATSANFFRDSNEAGRVAGMPWLYYKNSGGAVRSMADNSGGRTPFNTTYGFVDEGLTGSMVKELTFVIVKYNMDGSLVSASELGNELSLCEWTYQDTANFKKFGNFFLKTCDINFSEEFINQKQYFYELYLYSPKDKALLDVPVAIDGVSDGTTTNNYDNKADPSALIFNRRFYIKDKLSGIPNVDSIYPKRVLDYGVASYISYIKDVHVYVSFNRSDESKLNVINKPYVYIRYGRVTFEQRASSQTVSMQVANH